MPNTTESERSAVSPAEYARRDESLRGTMERLGIDCVLLNRRSIVKYLTGAENVCSWVFVKRDGRRLALVLESDYALYRRDSILEDVRPIRAHDPLSRFRRLIDELELVKQGLVLEKDHLTHAQYEMLENVFGACVDHGYCADRVFYESEMVKTPEQIDKVRAACRLAAVGFEVARDHLRPGLTELDLLRLIDAEIYARGGDLFAYVATDLRSGLAHAPASANVIDEGPVIIDLHVACEGYHCDVARTFFVADDPRHREMYESLRATISGTIPEIRASMPMTELRRTFYRKLERRPDWVVLTGPLVHGVGISNQELPDFDHPLEARGYPEIVQAGTIIALSNIGFASPEGWGVRYEETFLVGEEGSEALSAGC